MAGNTDQFKFNILSVNVNGINDRKKRRNIFRWVKKNKYDICYLQETYSTTDVENIWKNEWGGNILFSHGTSHARGVCILIKPGFDVNVSNMYTDNTGRYLLAEVTIQDTDFKLINIYAPNNEENQVNFYRILGHQIQSKIDRQDHILLGGDFNVIVNPEIDRKGGAPITMSKHRRQILKYLEDIKDRANLKDIWRTRNPDVKRFTWRRATPIIKSRLDYWLISEKTEDFTSEADIVPFNNTDHSAIILKLSSLVEQQKGRGIWRLNTSFLDEEPYIKLLIEEKEVWMEEFKDVTDYRLKWELVKYCIRQLSMKYGKAKALNMKKTETELETEIKRLEEEQDKSAGEIDAELEAKMAELKAKVNEIAEYKTQGLILRSRAEWYGKEEKSTKYFLQLEARNRIRKVIRRLQRSDGTLATDEKEILDMQAHFYEHLYSEKITKTHIDMEDYLTSIDTPKLSDIEMQECEGTLTLEECRATLSTFKTNKAPGNDGLPIEFYKRFWHLFGQLALNSFNYAYEHGEMSTSQRQAVITLLDKGKDRSLLKNWRPISLLNVDYKIMSKALANRCKKYLSKLICENQVGFVKGRNITDNIRSVSDILQFLKDEEQPGIMVNIDFEKAFDSVNWEFMLLTLEKFNFGPSLVKWVKTIYKNISSCVINNGHTSKYFDVRRGVRQGDPLSPYLFVLIVEIMANKIRQERHIEGIEINHGETKLLQYADDTSGLVNNLKSAKCFLKTVNEFGQFSGLTMNVQKTECMWLGSNRFNKTKPLGVQWPDRPLRILGVYFCYDQDACDKVNFLDRIDKAKRILNWWTSRNLTLYGRIQIIKTFVMSQFMYVSSVICTPPDVINMVNKLVFKFIWRNKRERLKRTVLLRNIADGGMQAPDFQTMVNTARLKWITKMTGNVEAPWKLILDKYMDKVNINLNMLLYSNFNMKTSGLAKAVIPDFYREMLKLWSEVGNTMPVAKSNFLWYNKQVLVNGKSVFYKELFKAGAWYIHDLYETNGTVVTFETWVSRGVGRHNMIKWMGLIQKTKALNVDHAEPSTDEIVQLSLSFKKSTCMQHTSNKDIYNGLLATKTKEITTVYVPRISNHLQGIEQVDWKEVYLRANKTTIDTKTK